MTADAIEGWRIFNLIGSYQNWESVKDMVTEHAAKNREEIDSTRIPAVGDMFQAFREHGLWDYTTAIIFNDFQLSLTGKGTGMAELAGGLWDITFP